MLKTCQSCKHWHKQPRQTALLDEPTVGECRERLHSAPVMGQRGMLGMNVYYPSVPEGFQACGQHEERVLIPEDNRHPLASEGQVDPTQIGRGIPVVMATGETAEKLAAMGTPIFGMP